MCGGDSCADDSCADDSCDDTLQAARARRTLDNVIRGSTNFVAFDVRFRRPLTSASGRLSSCVCSLTFGPSIATNSQLIAIFEEKKRFLIDWLLGKRASYLRTQMDRACVGSHHLSPCSFRPARAQLSPSSLPALSHPFSPSSSRIHTVYTMHRRSHMHFARFLAPAAFSRSFTANSLAIRLQFACTNTYPLTTHYASARHCR